MRSSGPEHVDGTLPSKPARASVGLFLHRILRPPCAAGYTQAVIDSADCRVLVDIGCGSASPFTGLRGRFITVGVEAFAPALAVAKSNGAHNHYIFADVLSEDISQRLGLMGIERVDVVAAYQVVEHLSKDRGLALLDRMESLTSKYVIVETPNGFREQGPEFGNEMQRHLSGWFIHDFEGRGYHVFGSTGTRHLRGYASGPRYSFKGCASLDMVLARALMIRRFPRHAYNLLAIKDVRGAPARL